MMVTSNLRATRGSSPPLG